MEHNSLISHYTSNKEQIQSRLDKYFLEINKAKQEMREIESNMITSIIAYFDYKFKFYFDGNTNHKNPIPTKEFFEQYKNVLKINNQNNIELLKIEDLKFLEGNSIHCYEFDSDIAIVKIPNHSFSDNFTFGDQSDIIKNIDLELLEFNNYRILMIRFNLCMISNVNGRIFHEKRQYCYLNYDDYLKFLETIFSSETILDNLLPKAPRSPYFS